MKIVMAVLVTAIHDTGSSTKSWIAGTCPAKTRSRPALAFVHLEG